MSWTQGQKPRVNLPPFIEPEEQENKSDSRHSNKSGYQKDNTAATFTKEGLETFSLIFSSAVEAAIAKHFRILFKMSWGENYAA